MRRFVTARTFRFWFRSSSSIFSFNPPVSAVDSASIASFSCRQRDKPPRPPARQLNPRIERKSNERCRWRAPVEKK
eukprot:277275-Prorocentrum_minimum.AAC.1